MDKVKRLSKDTVSGCVFLIFIMVLAIEALKINNSESARFVFLVLGGMAVSASLMIVSGIKSKENNWKQLVYKKKETVILAILLLSYFLINILGFYTVVFILSFSVYLIVEGKRDKKSILKAIVYSAAFTGFIVLVCVFLLKLAFPIGVLF